MVEPVLSALVVRVESGTPWAVMEAAVLPCGLCHMSPQQGLGGRETEGKHLSPTTPGHLLTVAEADGSRPEACGTETVGERREDGRCWRAVSADARCLLFLGNSLEYPIEFRYGQ